MEIVYYGSSEGFKYLVFGILMAILIFSDVYFLERIKKLKKAGKCFKTSIISPIGLFISFLILLEILFKFKLSSIITYFAKGKSYLLNYFLTFIFIIPILLSYDLELNCQKDNIHLLEIYFYINLIIKCLIVIIAIIPVTKHSHLTKFLKSGYDNLSQFTFSEEKC